MRVVVAGAGLGGLCVANGLHKAGVDVEVFEARDGIHDAGQGYRININATGHNALRACLADEHFQAYEHTLHSQSDPAVYLYSPALQLLSRDEAPSAPGAIDRATVRRLLADGLAGRVRFGRRVASIVDIGAADLIVAADGVGSVLRQELVPHASPHPLGLSAIFGRSLLTAANRAWTAPVILHSRFCGLVDGATVLALCAYDPPARTAAEPYVMWVLMGPADELPAPATPAAELVRFARNRTPSWDSRATSVLREAIVADCFLTSLRSMTEIPDIPVHPGVPVAFLGDAIHAMSPAGGEGANTALGDAALLVSHLLAGGTIADTVARYHADMRTTAGAALRRSASYRAQEPSPCLRPAHAAKPSPIPTGLVSDRRAITVSTSTDVPVRQPRGITGVLPYLLDIIIPLVSYYVLTAVGLSSFWSLVMGGGLTAIVSILNTIRRGRVDNLGVLVIMEIGLGLVLDLAVRDPRLTLARGSLFIALAGIWILVNTFTGRPVTVDITKTFAAKKGGKNGIIAFEWLADNSKRFVRIQRSLSAVWGVMFLAYVVVRVTVIYSVSISEAAWLTEIPGIIAVVICLIASARAGKQLETLVNDRMEHTSGKPA